MRDPGPLNVCGKAPAGISAVSFQFSRPMMSRNMLQIRHAVLDFTALRHRVNEIIQQRLVVETTSPKQSSAFFTPRLHRHPFLKRYQVAFACEDATRKVGVSTP